jgi:hypothetical protein
MDAYRLLGLNYISKDLEEQARDCIYKLLILHPNYRTDEDKDPRLFIQLVEEERKDIIEKQQAQISKKGDDISKPLEKESTSIWWYIGGGLLAVIAVIIVAISGGGNGGGGDNGEEENDLPGPPDLP